MVEAADRSGIGHDAPALLPVLVSVDVPQHEGLGLCREQRTRRELVVEAGHRHVVLGDAPGDRAVRHADGRHQRLTCRLVAGRKPGQQGRQFLAQRDTGVRRADARGDGRLVHRRHAREQDPCAVGQLVLRAVEAPALRADPGAVQAQRHLADAIGHMHAVAAPEQAEDGQRARWLVGEGALQHQHRTVIRQPAHLARQAFDRRAVHVERVVGRVARDDRDFGAAPDGLVHRKAEAAVGLGQVLLAVVQVGKLRDPDHGVTSL